MTVGIRSHPYQAQNAANMLQFGNIPGQLDGKSPYVVDEQTVPQALYQPQMNAYKDLQPDFQNMDPLAYNQWYNSQSYPSYNTDFMAYPTIYQPDYDTSAAALQGNAHATLRQNSYQHSSLDQFLPEFDYQQVFENLDIISYENPELFCLEDYANMEQVNEGVNFDVAVKQEKADCDHIDGKNLEELENVLNNNILNSNNPMVNVVTTDSPVSNIGGINNTLNNNSTNDQTLDEQNLLDILDMYSSEWQSTTNNLPPGNQMVAGETIVKTEPNTSSCDFVLPGSPVSIDSDEGLSLIGIPDEELIQMPVSRFNDLLLSLTPEQSNMVKDIRRKGKNKQAARLCRKRKIDNISTLAGTLTQMEEAKSRLLNEQKEIIAETEELKSNIEMICEVLMKGLNGQNIALSELSLVHHSNGQTLVVQK